MDEKTLQTLEYSKVLDHLCAYAAFSASKEMAKGLSPTSDPILAQERQAYTSEARRMLEISMDVGIGGVHDIRPDVDLCGRGGVLEAPQLLEIKSTLMAARELGRSFSRFGEAFPRLSELGRPLPPPAGIIDSISRAISDNGEILDEASEKLAQIRREIKFAHQRLMAYLERLITNPNVQPMLQEAIVTQRGGRYVIPLRADFKGRIRAIIHDQSSSGATIFIEPLPAVELNNNWHELQLAERDEVRRILIEICGRVGEVAEPIKCLVEALARIDFCLMCARYSMDLQATEPILTAVKETQFDHPGTVIKLLQARHPLLDQQTVVPIDVELDDKTYAVVITGPNTGGKTVTLKTVGLLVLMAQSGIHIPVRSGSTLSVFDDVYADIGDEQSIEQSLSTFSGHITNIVRIVRHVSSNSLVLFDELGSGTDPQEGAALARAILEHLLTHRVTCFIATHFAELKAFAHNSAGAINASMEFDVRSLRPTYHLTVGLPGRSNAILIARRLGLPEEILSLAKQNKSARDRKADNLLDEIRHQRELANRKQREVDENRNQANQLRKELTERLGKIDQEKQAVLEQARKQVADELESVHEEIRNIRQAIRHRRPGLNEDLPDLAPEEIKIILEKVETLVEEVQKKPTRSRSSISKTKRPLKVGDRVFIRSLKMEGRIINLDDEEAEIQLGSLRMRAKRDEIQIRGEDMDERIHNPEIRIEQTSSMKTMHPSPGIDLNLRGQRAEEALEAMRNHLEAAYLAGLPMVRIVHGKGTGRLREAVRIALRSDRMVSSFENGLDNEGGEGVTVVKIKTE